MTSNPTDGPEEAGRIAKEDNQRAIRRVRRHAERIRRRELDDGLGHLEGEIELTPAQKEVLEQLTRRLTEAVVAEAEATLRETDDPKIRRAVRRLFDPVTDDR